MANWYISYKDDDLMHYGILGMRWGVRRFQNPDGTLTNAGKKRYIRDIQNYPINGSISSQRSIELNKEYKKLFNNNVEKRRKIYEKFDKKANEAIKQVFNEINVNKSDFVNDDSYTRFYNKIYKELRNKITEKTIKQYDKKIENSIKDLYKDIDNWLGEYKDLPIKQMSKILKNYRSNKTVKRTEDSTVSDTTKRIANKLLLGASYIRKKPEEITWTSNYASHNILYTVIDNNIDKIEKDII